MRHLLEKGLQELKEEIGRMGGLVEDSVAKTILALKEIDIEIASEIVKRDDEIDRIETKIERHCLSLFALQQPLAGDLRFIGSSLKMITDLERIADHSADIAEITQRLYLMKPVKINPDIFKMAEIARGMVIKSIDAFINHDLESASSVCQCDDEVDRLFNEMILELVNQIKASPQNTEQAIDLMFVVKYLERMADHATNICEWVVYNETGRHHHMQHPENHPYQSEDEV